MNRPTAKAAYQYRLRAIRGLLNRVRGLVGVHERDAGADLHWGHVGDLGRILELLAEAVQGLRGERSAQSPPVQPGDRIRLILMVDDPDPLPEGSEGIVTRVTTGSYAQVDAAWDSGRSLALLPGVDSWEVIHPEVPASS